MIRRIATPGAGAPSGSSATTTKQTAALLACGVVAGPLFIVVGLLQMLTRDGFDPTRHPLSLLSLGDLGWVQIGNFVVTGVLYLAGAVGMWRVLRPGRGGTWGPLLVAVYGVGLVMGGVFVTDAGAGFPPGAPAGAPGQISWHGALHAVAPVLASVALIAACLVFARRFAAGRQRGWAAYCLATAAIDLAPGPLSNHDLFIVVLGASAALGLVWVSVMAARLLTGLPAASGPINARIQPASSR